MTNLQLIQLVIYFNVLIIVFLLLLHALNALKDYNFIYNTTLRQRRLDMLKKFDKYKGLTISSPIVARDLKLRGFE
jgi:hypothetical protein